MDEHTPLIFMVEDDIELAQFNARFLTRNGYKVLLAANAAEARALFSENKPDLFVLDVALPDGNGITLCEEFRRETDAPVMFLTGKDGLGDKVAGYTSGGDYYMTKPYVREELLAVVGSQLRRAALTQKRIAEATAITRGPLTLNIPTSKAFVNGRDAELTAKEFAILLMLVQNEGKELSGEAIYTSVWGTDMNHDSTVIRNHVSRLKKKLDEENTDGFSIVNLYGGAYIFTTK